MSYQKIADLIHRIYKKTMEGELQWEKTITNDIYQISFRKYSVKITKQESNTGSMYLIGIFNDKGVLLEEVSNRDLIEFFQDPYDTLKEMYDTARRQSWGVESALDDILMELDSNNSAPF